MTAEERDRELGRAKFRPGMCRNCSCPQAQHMDSDDRPCLRHEDCHRYEPLGRKLAAKLNAVRAAGEEGRSHG